MNTVVSGQGELQHSGKYSDFIGETTDSATFVVQDWHIREFAFATGDPHPAVQAGSRAPLTLVHALREGKNDLLTKLGVDYTRLLHGHQAIAYRRPLIQGDWLQYRIVVSEAYQKKGRRGGSMEFFVLDTLCTDLHGEEMLRASQTFLEVGDGASSVASSGTSAAERRIREVAFSLTKPPITRLQIARYAGASGDYNRVHIDEPFALSSGRPSVWAHGMLGMAFLGHALEATPGVAAIRRFECRFVDLVFPGDVLQCAVAALPKYGTSDTTRVELQAWRANNGSSGSQITHVGSADVVMSSG